MTRFGWQNAKLNGHISLVHRSLPQEQQEQWMEQFADPEGYIEQWLVTLLSLAYAERHVKHPMDHKYFGWTLRPYAQKAIAAGLNRDWTEFDSVLGIWELSEAKD